MSPEPRKELSELDTYIQDKIKDLVMKFRLIAENAASSAKNIPEDNGKGTLVIAGKEYTYSEATKELHRLTDAILSEAQMTKERIDVRKKMDKLSLALYKYGQENEGKVTNVMPNIQIINANIKDIIIAFQFQDFVKQRLTHIDIILEALENETTDFLNDFSAPAPVNDSMVKNLMDKFFLSDVKQTFLQGLDPEQAKNINVTIESEGDDIELF